MAENIFLLDLGSAFTKIGLASQNVPYLITPSAYGIPRIETINLTESTGGQPQNRILYGDKLNAFTGAIFRDDLFPYSQPKDNAAIFAFIEYIFGKFSLPTNNTGLVLALSPDWSNDFLFQLKTHLYQKYNFLSILPIQKDLLALICHRLKTGIVLDVGHYQSSVNQFNNGKPLTTAGFKSNVAGKLITKYLIKLYHTTHPYLHSPMFNSVLHKILHEKCQLTLDVDKILSDQDLGDKKSEDIEIPQLKETLTLGIERYIAPEVLFHPQLANSKGISVDSLVVQSLKECHPSLRTNIYSNIVLAGGGCTFLNFKERLNQSFSKIPLLANSNLKMLAEPQLTVWEGMRIVANSSFYGKNVKTQTQFFAKL
jgi:actin-related protein